jgi:hypothetical protein
VSTIVSLICSKKRKEDAKSFTLTLVGMGDKIRPGFGVWRNTSHPSDPCAPLFSSLAETTCTARLWVAKNVWIAIETN